MFKNTFGKKTTLVESHRSQKSPLKTPFKKNKLYGLSFCARCIFKVWWGSKWVPKTIVIYYKFKNTFGIKIALLESHRSQKSHYRLDFFKTCYKELVFVQGEFIGFFGAPNESLRLIKIILEQNNFSRVTLDPKKSVKGSISAKLVIRT